MSSREMGKGRQLCRGQLVAQKLQNVEVVKITSPALNVLDTMPNDNLIDLYSVGHKEVTRSMCNIGIKVPF
jgi:hypothetical protein